MKFGLSLALTVAAFTGSQAMAEAPVPMSVLAQVQSFGGFVPPPGNPPNGVRIYRDGRVFRFRDQNNSELVAQLSLTRLKKLIQVISQMESGDLPAAEGPRCADAPSTVYQVRKSAREVLKIAAQVDCRLQILQNGNANEIKTILDGLNTLARLD